ncbi:MAG: hypothetical protein ABSF33_15350 [Acidimicrobiales bacterium]|jgi:hypothetical protein
MDLQPYVDEIHRQLEATAESGGEDARALARRLAGPLDSAIRLALLEALAAATQEITCELAPGSVEVRFRGRDPEFVVTSPAEPAGGMAVAVAGESGDSRSATGVPTGVLVGDEGGLTRINLRMPEHLKSRVDHAAVAEGLSVNAWLVRAAATAVGRVDPASQPDRHGGRGAQRFTGWAR